MPQTDRHRCGWPLAAAVEAERDRPVAAGIRERPLGGGQAEYAARRTDPRAVWGRGPRGEAVKHNQRRKRHGRVNGWGREPTEG